MAEYINNTEYIDRKELVNNINRLVKLTNKDEQEWVKDECIRQAYCIQKADVVPRSEFDAYKREVEDVLERLNVINEDKIKVEVFLAKQEVAREIIADFRKMIKGYENIDVYLDRIEKKYIGE